MVHIGKSILVERLGSEAALPGDSLSPVPPWLTHWMSFSKSWPMYYTCAKKSLLQVLSIIWGPAQ